MEAMWTRFLPHMAEIRRLLADGALEGLLESPLMPLDETVAIMETMDAVLACGK